MRISAMVTIAALCVLAIGVGPARTAPKPAIIPGSWELSIDVKQPQPIEIYIPGQARPKLFWYLRYTLTNRTGEDQMFVPEFFLYTSTGQALRAGRGIPSEVFNKIKQRHNEPLLHNRTAMAGRIRQGRDYAKKGVAIWPDFDSAAGQFDIFIGGLSGESAEVKLPKPVTVTDKLTGKKKTVNSILLTKTMRLRYAIVGEAEARNRTPVKLIAPPEWVMR